MKRKLKNETSQIKIQKTIFTIEQSKMKIRIKTNLKRRLQESESVKTDVEKLSN